MEITAQHRKDSILFTTIDVIDEFGIHAVSTREIAKRLGIAESTVFKYYPKKVDLFEAVLDLLSVYDNDLFKSARLKKMRPREAILFYIDSYSVYFQNYPAITALTQAYDVLRYEAILSGKVKSMLLNRNEFFSEMIEEARTTEKLPINMESDSLAGIIISTVTGICLMWRLCGYSFSLRDKTADDINKLLDVFLIR